MYIDIISWNWHGHWPLNHYAFQWGCWSGEGSSATCLDDESLYLFSTMYWRHCRIDRCCHIDCTMCIQIYFNVNVDRERWINRWIHRYIDSMMIDGYANKHTERNTKKTSPIPPMKMDVQCSAPLISWFMNPINCRSTISPTYLESWINITTRQT